MTSSSASTNRNRHHLVAAVVAAFAAIVVIVIWVPGLWRGVTGDEVALVTEAPLADVFWDPEGTANPPLQRLVVNAVAPHGRVIETGRLLSLICGMAALAWAFVIARRAASSAVTAAVAVLLLAVNPTVVEHAAQFRSYVPWLAVAIWHAGAMRGLLRDGPQRTAAYVGAAASAAFLPWLHYLSVPILVLDAVALLALYPSRWRRFAVYVPAVVCAAPLLLLITMGESRRLPAPAGGIPQMFWQITAAGWMDVAMPLLVWLVALGVAAFRKRDRELASWLVGCAAAMAGTLAMVPFFGVRPPTAIFALPWLIPTIALALRRSRAFTVATSLLVVFIAIQSGLGIVRVTRPGPRDAVQAAAKDWAFVGESDRLAVYPPVQIATLHYELTGRSLRARQRDQRCARDLCFVLGGVVVEGVDDPARAVGRVAVFEANARGMFEARCRRLRDGRYALFDCAVTP